MEVAVGMMMMAIKTIDGGPNPCPPPTLVPPSTHSSSTAATHQLAISVYFAEQSRSSS